MFAKVNVERIFLIFSAPMGGQKGPVFYIYYERITGHRSKLKIFCRRGFHFRLDVVGFSCFLSGQPFCRKRCVMACVFQDGQAV